MLHVSCRYVKRSFTCMSYHNMSSATKPMPGQAWCRCAVPTIRPMMDTVVGKAGALEGNARVEPSCGPCVIALPSRAPGFGGLHHETYCGCRTTAPALAWHELSCENHIVQHMYANERLTERHSKCGTRNLHKTYSIELLVLMARTNVRSYLFVRFG